ncbi:adenosine kinase [Planctomicrobium sp. SH661]|uniref:adenosine kinase n=1 Tax=Planctomicrobium sp. SH661 TaxID=3448124 RepID=UPI003F5C9BF8
MQYDVYGIGNALVDIQAHVSDETLEALHFAKGIMTLVEDGAQQQVLSHLHGHQVTRCAGGSAANTIMGIAEFGGKVAYAGKVAQDPIGEFFLSDMRNRGVRIEIAPGEGQSGSCVILITDDAQRTMLTNLAVSSTLQPEDINEELIRQSKYVYVEGYLFTGEPNHSSALRAIELAKKNNVKVAFTVSDPFLIQYHKDEFWKLIEGPVDLLFCNLDEARALTGQHDAVECAREIHRHAENVALTLGAEGSLLMHKNEAIFVPGVPVKAVDTTGAGDMYAAGILYGITNGLTWEQSGRLASHAASRIVGQLGARLQNPFTAEEIKKIIG